MKTSFPLNLPFRLASKIAKRTLEDPILKQFLPLQLESKITPGFIQDPVGDSLCRKETKLLHKYQGRVLLVCTSACAMHCRYCFRQNFDYDVKCKTFENEIAMIAQDSSIHEVILSGGDPLSLSDHLLEKLLQSISAISHVKRIRFHSRFPIGVPERIDASFLNLLKGLRPQIWFVIHTNHPKELDEDVLSHLQLLKNMGVLVLNQSVLLKDVNDTVETMVELCEKLVDHGILPYYLHQLDRVQGAAHFEVNQEKGLYLIQEIAKQLPGYAVPKFVKEIAGEPNKTPLF
jgi:EF-P beta-lysylation protein EpmB